MCVCVCDKANYDKIDKERKRVKQNKNEIDGNSHLNNGNIKDLLL